MIYISLLFKLSFKEKKVDWTGLDSNWTGLDSEWTGLDSDWTGLDSSPVKAIFWVESIWSPYGLWGGLQSTELLASQPVSESEKDQTFEWTDDCQKAFDELKKRFTEELVLMMPDQSAVLCSPPQSPYGLHWTPLDSIWTLPKKWPSLDWSPV